ncbi:MAG: hypothetical protein JSU70_05670, partial [Phycisphaerales bacterium]
MGNSKLTVAACFGLIAALLIGSAAGSDESRDKSVPPAPTDTFEIRNIEGWVVYIKKQDLTEHAGEMAEAIDHLQNQLYQIRMTVPAPAVAVMQERVPIWVEYDSDAATAFHPSYKWLLDRGYRSPEGLPSMVGICRAKNFCRNALHQPWMVLHELSHGYDYLYLGEGKRYSNSRIEAVYDRARQSGTYEAVVCRYAETAKHYAITNKMEYFAENTEAYFGTNDFYPFVRAELREHDPAAYTLLQDLWGVDARKQRRTTRSLAKFIQSQNGYAFAAREGKRTGYEPTARYEKRQIEGWMVYVCPSLILHKAFGDEVCKLLRHKLHLVKRYMPGKALGQLQKVPIWLEQNSPTVPYMTHHSSQDRLKAANENPDKLGAIEIADAEKFVRWQNLQQFAILNLLARAYYSRVPDEEAEEIRTAWCKAVESGKYNSALRFDG